MSIDSCTSVHNKETTVTLNTTLSYREYRERSCSAELSAVEQMYSRLDNEEGKSRLSLLRGCRSRAWFMRDKETGIVHVSSNACRLRWCPLCSGSRTAYITKSIEPWIQKQRFLRFLTLTLRHSNASLSNQIRYLYDSFRKLRNDKQFRKYCKGGIWFFQTKRDSTGEQWHPHIHALIVGKFIPHAWLSVKWVRITKNSNIVDIRAVKLAEKTAEYVARYAARPALLERYNLEERLDIFAAFHRLRLCGTWGKAREVSLSPPRSKVNARYECVGTWSTVTNLAKTNKIALTILKSWIYNTPLDEGLSVAPIDLWIDTGIEPDYTPYQPVHDYQPQFW